MTIFCTVPQRVIYECTWPGCGVRYKLNSAIERHVRTVHLSEIELTEKEEEFYYNELELEEEDGDEESGESDRGYKVAKEERSPVSNYSSGGHVHSSDDSNPSSDAAPSPGPFVLGTSSAPTWSHLDMARPPHEDPEYQRSLCKRLGGAGINKSSGPRRGSRGSNIPNVFKFSSSSGGHQSTPLNLSVNHARAGSASTVYVSKNSNNSAPNYKSLLQNGPLHHLHNHHISSSSNNNSSQSNNYNPSNYKLISQANSYPSYNSSSHRGINSTFHAGGTMSTTHSSSSSASTNNNSHNNKYLKIDKSGQSILLNGPLSGSKKHGSPLGNSTKGSSARGSAETRKCRKVYGMQGRDSWCTQCKWKKACTRFTNASKASAGGESKKNAIPATVVPSMAWTYTHPHTVSRINVDAVKCSVLRGKKTKIIWTLASSFANWSAWLR